MGAIKPLDKEITEYLPLLSDPQKEAIFMVMKTFAGEEKQYDHWEDASFVAELDRRTAEYESGKANLYTLDELETAARANYKAGKKDKE